MELRRAKKGDEHAIHKLIIELAVYEKEPDAVLNTPEAIAKDLFEDKICFAFVAELHNQVVGFALYYFAYSTWKGKSLYLEDLYVQPKYRALHIGSQLFDRVVEEAKNSKVRRMDWQVLDWNTPAIEFYKRKQALLDPSWINGRLNFE